MSITYEKNERKRESEIGFEGVFQKTSMSCNFVRREVFFVNLVKWRLEAYNVFSLVFVLNLLIHSFDCSPYFTVYNIIPITVTSQYNSFICHTLRKELL